MEMTLDLKKRLLAAQHNEITEFHVYKRIAASLPNKDNARIMEEIALDELKHYNVWKSLTGKEVSPNWVRVWFYTTLSKTLGFTFGIKLMERGEELAQESYNDISKIIPEIKSIKIDEESHEYKLIQMLDEEKLQYAGSVVLGLNDALVELTGALAGLTLALQNVQLIALSGLITGIAASFSMAASEYLSTRTEKNNKHPVRAAIYTGITYILTVGLLIMPYLLFNNIYLCLSISLITAVVIIALFNFYISVAKDEDFKKRFFEMAGLSLSVAALSFLLGYLIRIWLGVEI